MLAWTAALVYITGLSVTAGYHRLYSHTTYQAHPALEAVLLFFATMAAQGSALRWSFDHRHHHAFVDTDRDPYSIKKGFWYAHFMWLFEKPKEIENKVIADLLRKPLLKFQHQYYGTLMFFTNALVILLGGLYFKDFFGAFLFLWLVRQFFLHHFTWFINSLAHTWGARTFCQELSAVDNFLISLLTFGEGYHNYHHTFAYDYRNGIRWFHFDPTKWLIWTFSKVGLAYKLKKNHRYFIEEKLLTSRKQILLEKIHTSFDSYKEVWEEKIHNLHESILVKLKHVRELRESYYAAKKKRDGDKAGSKELHQRLKEAKKELKKECKHWTFLTRQMNLSSSSSALPDN